MKKATSFWESLEKYSWNTIKRSALPQYWPWVGVGLVAAIVVASLVSMDNSVTAAMTQQEIALKAAERGDYETAKTIFKHYTNQPLNHLVLGAESELEDKIYPERAVERRIAVLEEKLGDYPESKAIYLMLSSLYDQLGNEEMSNEYREKARVLDPNGSEFR